MAEHTTDLWSNSSVEGILQIDAAEPGLKVSGCGCEWPNGPDATTSTMTPCTDGILPPGDPVPAGRCPECCGLVYLRRPIDLVRDHAQELLDALKWFIDNDDTNEGDAPLPEYNGRSWNEINAYWIDGLNRARKAIAIAKATDTG